jgi:DNA modification methylase
VTVENFNRVIIGDCRETLRALPDSLFQCCVTSPPYWGLRDYGVDGQLGLEKTPEEYVANMVAVFREVRRVLRDDGTLWLNLGDSYAATTKGSSGKGEKQRSNAGTLLADRACKVPNGMKPKDLCGIPWSVAFALRADGWYLRSDIIWHKSNPMPEPVTDRPTKAHEYVFLLSKSERYFYDQASISEKATHAGRTVDYTGDQKANDADPSLQRTLPRGRKITVSETRNARTVWTVASQGYDGAHFATMPAMLAQRCILAGSNLGSAVLDPFMGSGTVGMVAEGLGRRWIGCELNPEYETLTWERTAQAGLPWRLDEESNPNAIRALGERGAK